MHRLIAKTFALAALLAALLATPLAAEPLDVTSPNGELAVRVYEEGGHAFYTLTFRETQVFNPSRLGLEFRTLPNMSRDVEVSEVGRSQGDRTWEQPWGERQRMREHYNELTVALNRTEKPELTLHVRFRVFDDGIGFRYEMPAQNRVRRVDVIADYSEFNLADAGSTTALHIFAEQWNRYEHLYRRVPASDVVTAATPITFKRKDGIHLSIHEAALIDWAGFTLAQRALGGVLRAKLTPWSDGIAVKTALPFKSSWRTVQVAPNAVGLLNSDLILNLNEPNRLGDVSWVKPGKYTGVWWEMHRHDYSWESGPRHGATEPMVKSRIDFAAKYGFDGVLVEGWNMGWDGNWLKNGEVFSFTESYPDFDLPMLAKYAAERGVKLIGHHETSGNVENYKRQMGDAYDLYEKHGVEQVKTGYVAWAQELVRYDDNGHIRHEWHDGQWAVAEYLRSITEAAKRGISINTHEPVKDTGLRRTYPNWLTREGARGQEFNSAPGSFNSVNPPDHNVNLVYTRMLSGPMDFTPGIFDLLYRDKNTSARVKTTLVHQLALYVALYSPVQMVPDYQRYYEQYPDAFQFIVDVPTDFSHSIALAGEMGDYVVWARKQRDARDWYVGAITGNDARIVEVPLDFLDAGVTYTAEIYREGPRGDWNDNPFDYVIEQREVTAADVITARVGAAGGLAVRLSP